MAREADHVVRSLVELCKSLDIKCLIQIGAEDGYEASEIQNATGCRAVCIDADPRTIKCSQRIEFHRLMIGDKDEMTHFFVNNVMGLSGGLSRGVNQEQHMAAEQLTLDTFCANQTLSPDALIIDTEGTIMQVLVGAENTLKTVRMIYGEASLEGHGDYVKSVKEVDEWLGVRGFVRRDGWPSYLAETQGNFVWVRN